MCTVTFIPAKDKFFITSNRDEKVSRKIAIPPVVYKRSGYNLIFPKDADKGGTWVAMKENGGAAVLLNGAFLPHVSQPHYRMSRGQILLDILDKNRSASHLVKVDLEDIEPFTIVLLERNLLYEFRWDGQERYCKQISAHRPHIWSSSTLYDRFAVKKREQWFAEFMSNNPNPTQQDIMNFHRFSGDGDNCTDLLINRDGVHSTVSITCMLLTTDRGSMKYLDLKQGHLFEKKMEFIQSEAV